jgi:hypothetical protein
MKKIEKSFDDLKNIFANEELVEKLISKKYIFNLHKKKIESITIEENIIQCTYSPDSIVKSYKLIFEKNTINQIDFTLKIPFGFFAIILITYLAIHNLIEFGWVGIFIGIGIYYLAILIYKYIVKQGIIDRINKSEVNNL